MGKYEKRKVFRLARRTGMPFLLAAWYSRKPGHELAYRMDTLPEGFSGRFVQYCECCGPERLVLSETKTGKEWGFDYWTGLPD